MCRRGSRRRWHSKQYSWIHNTEWNRYACSWSCFQKRICQVTNPNANPNPRSIDISMLNFWCRFKSGDNPSCISKGAPDFCTVYIISKGKISSIRKALRPAPFVPNHRTHKHNQPPQPQITKQAPEPQRTTNKYRQHHHYYTESMYI